MTADDTFVVLALAQTISAVKTHSADIVLNDTVNLGLGTSSGEGTIRSDGTAIKIGSVAGKDIILGDDNEVMRVSGGDVVIFGSGEGGATAATGKTLRAPDITTGGAGNIAGADLTIIPGLGTGTGDVGQTIFQAVRVAASGDNIQTLNTAFVLDDDGTNPVLDLQNITTLTNIGTSGQNITASGLDGIAGEAGNEWTANKIQAQATNSGGLVQSISENLSNTASAAARFLAQVAGSSATGDAYFQAGEVSGTFMRIGVDVSASLIVWSRDNSAIGTDDIIRVTDASPPVITYNTTHPTGTFDYVCPDCGHHSDGPFVCHGQRAGWQDDVMVFRSMALRQESGIDQMVKVGVMERTFDNEGRPEVFTKLGADWLFVGAMAYQNRLRMDSLHLEHETRFSTVEDRVGALEEAQEILRAQVVALGGMPEA